MVLAIGILFVIAFACAPTEPTSTPTPSPEITGRGDSGDALAGSLSRGEACDEFFDIVSDLTLSDDESAAKFRALASRTRDSDLADAIREVGDKFAAHAEEISSEEVLEQCDG